jgi:hypothetical protein
VIVEQAEAQRRAQDAGRDVGGFQEPGDERIRAVRTRDFI